MLMTAVLSCLLPIAAVSLAVFQQAREMWPTGNAEGGVESAACNDGIGATRERAAVLARSG
jgi:hypothetical protein